MRLRGRNAARRRREKAMLEVRCDRRLVRQRVRAPGCILRIDVRGTERPPRVRISSETKRRIPDVPVRIRRSNPRQAPDAPKRVPILRGPARVVRMVWIIPHAIIHGVQSPDSLSSTYARRDEGAREDEDDASSERPMETFRTRSPRVSSSNRRHGRHDASRAFVFYHLALVHASMVAQTSREAVVECRG